MTQENSAGLLISQARTKITHYASQKQALYFHASLYVMALLVGIARYSRSLPQELIILLTVWSVGLLIHGALVYRAQMVEKSRITRDGILNATLLFTTLNGVMWGMWTLATDGRDPGVWHVSVLLVLLTLSVAGVIAGKRALYRHWLNEYLHASADQPEETKLKRERRIEIDDEGELWLDDDAPERRSSDAG